LGCNAAGLKTASAAARRHEKSASAKIATALVGQNSFSGF
jgi:hypothetical protein